jgi:hypothetical protein
MTSLHYTNCFIIKPYEIYEEVLYTGCDLHYQILDDKQHHYNSSIMISEFSTNLSSLDQDYEITGCYDQYLTKTKIEEHYFAGARIDFFMHDFASRSNSQIIKRGFVISAQTDKNKFTFKLQSLKNFLFNKRVNYIYSKGCRAEFGDKYCTLNLTHLAKQLGYMPSCDKTKKSCRMYNNIANYRGE